jgi:hypothetical protein
MRVVIDVVAAAFGHIDRISQEQDCIEDGGHLDEVEIDGIPGADEDESEQYRAYCTGSAQAPIVVVVFPFEIGRDIGGDERRDVEDEEIIVLQPQLSHVIILQCLAEKVQGEHIESQVHEIGMDESAGDEAVILMTHMDGRRPEDKVIHQFMAVKGENGNERGQDNDAYCEACHWIFFMDAVNRVE